MLILLELRFGRTSMLMGRWTAPPLGTGEPGGLAMVAAPRVSAIALAVTQCLGRQDHQALAGTRALFERARARRSTSGRNGGK